MMQCKDMPFPQPCPVCGNVGPHGPEDGGSLIPRRPKPDRGSPGTPVALPEPVKELVGV